MNRQRTTYIIVVLLLLLVGTPVGLSAQGAKSSVRSANKNYYKQNYAAAEYSYRKALEQDNTIPQAVFGLGATLYKQDRQEEAFNQFKLLVERSDLTPTERAELLHNMGNVMMLAKDYRQAMELYQEALLANPEKQDEGTRYNFVLARKLLQDQQDDQQQQRQDASPETNPNQRQAPTPEGDRKKADDDEKGKQDSQDMSRESAEQILDAYKKDEDETRRRIDEKRKENKDNTPKSEKPW